MFCKKIKLNSFVIINYYRTMNDNTVILQKLSEDNETSLQKLYDQYAQMVYQFAFQILKDEAHATEILQDTFLQLWQSRSKLDHNSNIKTFIYVICRNKCFNRLKEIKRHQRLFEPLSPQSLYEDFIHDDPLSETEVKEVLELIICKLPPRQQQIFRLSRFDGLSHNEIAQQLEISSNTVKNHLVAALKFVKTEFKNNHLLSSLHFPLLFYFFFK